jgi:uncharacterized BrkB/YihY/UPF0761 family membrane protein
MNYFAIYYVLMCYLGALVIIATIMRNRAKTTRRCELWNDVAVITWHIGAILFIIYLTDLIWVK